MRMKVLFIGGTGVISSACTQRGVEKGFQMYLLNRGKTKERPVPKEAKVLHADFRKDTEVESILKKETFDVVVDWICYTPEQAERDVRLFKNRTGQFIFIGTASSYQTPPVNLPITESTPLSNPFWKYSQQKIACEEIFLRAYREFGFPITIVRPSHTYDRTLLPTYGRYNDIDRIRKGKKVVVHGDGTSLWVLTHHLDFAKGFIGLLGSPHAIGEAFHITSDEVLTWNQIMEILGQAVWAKPNIVHIPSQLISAYFPEWGESLLGDKMHSMIFDNSKIKKVVPEFQAVIPFSQGAKEIIAWYDAHPKWKVIDEEYQQKLDQMIHAFESVWPA